MSANNDNSQLKTGMHEPVKQFQIFDVTGRVTHLYEARANAEDGDPCMLTQYSYDGVSSRIEKTLESVDSWDSDWDI